MMIELECASKKSLDGAIATIGVQLTSRCESYIHLHKPSIVNMAEYRSFYIEVFSALAVKES
jgi:hypothetical protein